MEKLAEELWSVRSPLRFLGLELGTQMTVARLDGGHLWVHSPVALTPALRESLDALGTVRWVVAPNRFHHLFVPDFAAAYPEAELLACPGLLAKRPDVDWTAALGDHGPWPDLEAQGDLGMPMLDEWVFCHRPSGTLVVSDLIMHWHDAGRPLVNAAMKLDGVYGRPAVSRLFKWLAIRDRARLRDGIEALLDWPFDRLVVGHGRNVDAGAKDAVARAFAFL